MKKDEIEDGTWTRKLLRYGDAIWKTMIVEENVTHPRFRQARFVLENGPTILVASSELKRVVAGTKRRGETFVPLRIDLAARTINGQKVEFVVSESS